MARVPSLASVICTSAFSKDDLKAAGRGEFITGNEADTMIKRFLISLENLFSVVIWFVIIAISIMLLILSLGDLIFLLVLIAFFFTLALGLE